MSTQSTTKTEPVGQKPSATPDADKQSQEMTIDREQEQVKTNQEDTGEYLSTADS
jgi:hypothetical protein